ncbi:LOW QUALITY PROTEIN: formin-like protein 1 [Sinocyclocheilus rhinocerous]|nr:PREDICTED: LOW QUALITY PROTEIN: formin-like protein 1 [Sinocyclocheilus rhinocerous]
MGNAVGGLEQMEGQEAKGSTGGSNVAPSTPKKKCAPAKLPMPPEEELEERFSVVLSSMNLPPDKMKLLSQYDNEKKWELVCDQERFQVRNPPSAYLNKIKSFYQDQGGVARRFKKRVQESTQVLRELEISLRTNHVGWAQEFLNEENQGLDVLVDYLSYAQSDVPFEVESVENGGSVSDKRRLSERSVEDLAKNVNHSPTHGMNRAARALTVRISNLTHGRRTMRHARLASQRDDVHLCIMCLRAIMNYQSGFNLVMTHPRCVNEITLSLNNKTPRTKALVLELLAAVCLVRGGHDIIISAFDNFKEVSGEKNRFEKLMDYFMNDDSNIDFMVACMQFINIVVHSVENMNFRVHLQYEFTQLGLDQYLESLKEMESEKLQVQIQAYLDNVFDVGTLLEDAENKGEIMEHLTELQETNAQLNARLQEYENGALEKMAELEQQLMQATKESALLKESLRESCAQVSTLQQREREREIQREREREQERLSQPSQVDRERNREVSGKESKLEVKLKELEEKGLVRLERTASGSLDIEVIPVTVEKIVTQTVTVSDPASQAPSPPVAAPPPPPPLPGAAAPWKLSSLCLALRYDQQSLSLDFLELLERFIPSEYEMKLLQNYEKEGRPLEDLSEEDRFVVRFGKIPRLAQRINTLTFMGNFPESVKRLQPQLDAIIAASVSLKSSSKLKKMLEIILAFGNYMNSSKRGAAYGFRLQSLDLLLDTKSTDRTQTLMHFIANMVQDKYPELAGFHTELRFVDKAALVSLDSVLQDVRSLERGMEGTKKEFLVQDDIPALKEFVKANSDILDSLVKDGKTAQEAYTSVVEYYGENPKTTQPSMFFPLFVRFIKAYKQAEQDNEQKKKQESAAEEQTTPSPKKKDSTPQKGPMMPKLPQMDLIAELKKRQVKPQVTDGAIEDIITDLRNSPYRRGDGRRATPRQDN